MQTNNNIYFHYIDVAFYFPKRSQLKDFIHFIFQNEKKELETLNYVFCNDDYLLNYNEGYLNHNTLTDIITFELADQNEPTIGDIYISINRVKENATIHNDTFIKELHRVIFHGALHLCGYNDKRKDEQQLMRSKEDQYLSAYFRSTWNTFNMFPVEQ